MQRYLETLFRHKRLLLIPVIAIPMLTLLVTFYTGKKYVVVSSVWAETTRLIPNTEGNAPNVRGARLINDRLRTKAFRKEVMDASGLTDAIQEGTWPTPTSLQARFDSNALLRRVGGPLGLSLPQSPRAAAAMASTMIRRSVSATAAGSNLIFIVYTGSDPAVGQRLIEETLDIHADETLARRVREADVGVEYLTRELRTQEERVLTSAAKLASFESQYPPPPLGIQRPSEEVQDLQRLQQINALDESRYVAALNRLEDLRQRSDASLSSADLRFRIIDPPVGGSANSTVSPRKLGMMGVLGVTIGMMLGIIAIVLITWRDGTVRTKAEVESIIETPAIIEVPDLGRLFEDQPLLVGDIHGVGAPGRRS